MVLDDLIIELAFPFLEVSGALFDLSIFIHCKVLQLLPDLGNLLGLESTQSVMILIIMGFQLLFEMTLCLLQRDDVCLLRHQELVLGLHLKLHGIHEILKLCNFVMELIVVFQGILKLLRAAAVLSFGIGVTVVWENLLPQMSRGLKPHRAGGLREMRSWNGALRRCAIALLLLLLQSLDHGCIGFLEALLSLGGLVKLHGQELDLLLEHGFVLEESGCVFPQLLLESAHLLRLLLFTSN